MNKYEKIARWISQQNVSRTPNEKDIKEIAEYMFGEKLTKTGIKYVQEELANIDAESKKIEDNLNLQKTPIDYICEKLDAEGIEYEIEDDVYGENAPFDTYITILKGDDSRADDIICEVVGEAYQWVRDRDGNRRYCKVVTDPELIDEFNGTPVRDKKFKDEDICERLKKETNNFTKSFTGNIIVDGKDLMQAVRLLQKYYVDVDWKKLPPIKPSHPSGKQVPQYEIYGDTRKTIKDSKTEEPDLEFIVEFDNISPINCDTVEEVKDCIKKCRLFGSKAVEIKVYAPNGSTSVKNLRELKEFIEAYKEQMSLGDAKLTHKQKLWYAEELEKFIHPQYLRRNYQLKRIKRKRGK